MGQWTSKPKSSPSSRLKAFVSSLKGDLVTPSSLDYKEAISRWAINTSLRASIVVYPKDTSDIILTLAFARANGYADKLAVKGGGHNLAGSSSIEDGLVIDLSKYLNGVRVDEKEKKAYVGGGAIWKTVDEEAIKYGLATVGGTVNHTGVGGFTLGGGYGFLTSSYGLACDNLLSATLITSSGSLLTVSSTSHPSLFWAIRGGGGNFGIVTEFVYQLHPQRKKVYFGMLVFGEETGEEVSEVLKEWWKKAGKGESIMCVVGTGPDGKAAVIVIPFFNGSEEEGRRHFKAFLDIGPKVDKTGEVPYESVNDFLNFIALPYNGVYTKGVSLPSPSPSLFTSAFSHVLSICNSPKEKYGGIKAKLMFDYHPTGVVRSVPQEATAFRRDTLVDKDGRPVVSVVLHFTWLGEGDGELVDWEGDEGRKEKKTKTEVARLLAREIGELLTGESVDENPGYANYDGDANLTLPSHTSRYEKTKIKFGVESYGKLREVKRVYDPEGMFSRWFAVEP